MNSEERLSLNTVKKFFITNSSQLKPKQDRKVLQEELLRQQQDFREVHQQDLMKRQELQKFQNSAYDEFTQKKFIEDQKIIMELSGRRKFHE